MIIRPLDSSDVSAVADLQAAAFHGDELFARLYPRYKDVPFTVRHDWWHRLRQRMVRPGIKITVAEMDGEVVGCAVWDRGADAEWTNDTLCKRLERLLRKIEAKYYYLIDRELDKQALQHFMTNSDYKFYEQLSRSGFLHLASLAVSPKHQRKGIGKALIQWGMDVAAKEQVPVTLESSMVGRRMYASMGFVVIEKASMWAEFDGIAMLWEPPPLQGKWLEYDSVGNARVKDVGTDDATSGHA